MDGDFRSHYVIFYFFVQHACNLPMLDLKRVRTVTIMFHLHFESYTNTKYQVRVIMRHICLVVWI
jgi:hypothetical protein